MRHFCGVAAVSFAGLRPVLGFRPEAILGAADSAADLGDLSAQIPSLGATSPMATGGDQTRYIFFERDLAGFNNIRLQIESMVAIAAATGRTLVLPPPGHSDHVDQEFYEFEFFDAGALMSAVNLTLARKPDEHTLKVEEMLHSVYIDKLDKDRDWLFPMGPSRLHHFECLRLPEESRAAAAQAVLRGLVFDHHLVELAQFGLGKLGLSDGDFDCAHIRRGDFVEHGLVQMTDEDLSVKLKSMLSDRPLLVLSDGHPELDLGRAVKYASDAYTQDISEETRIAVDTIMCSHANDFVGSPSSTFTLGVMESRKRLVLLEGRQDRPLQLYAGSIVTDKKDDDLCWTKVTMFDAADKADF